MPGSAARLVWAAGALAALLAGAASAQVVALQGSMGTHRALLLIDGQPHTVAVGASVKGVTLRSLGADEAEVEVAGQRQRLRLGASPSRVGGAAAPGGGGSTILLAAGPGGHFVGDGRINGQAVRFLVDTGATTIAMGQQQASRLGVAWQQGQRAVTQTANGPVPVYLVTLNSVQVGDVEVANVAAVVLP
ncbi:MAG: TIGR02281 family clan AA aspartic protease, partial [Burkholderiales bacterium PBB5]